ncbi:MAG TPA: GvpL/GvpF family gas vesicle protein [Vicinamibacterales bacterium]|jgi:hypothetical protein|nr:GvpL/GvpF family gas vesicle protein [Vicinamibacterales bacterium]
MMSSAGTYLYGFTDRQCQAPPDLRGLAGAPIHLVPFGDLAAVVSDHPVQRLMPLRRHVEPHHAVVRHLSTHATLVPAAFGHISETEDEILAVMQGNYDDIRAELARLGHCCEMSVTLRWSVDNVFEWLVRHNRDLRTLRDRVFKNRQPSMNEKLQVGAQFEATLSRERELLTKVMLDGFAGVIGESVTVPPRDERVVCQASLLVHRQSVAAFEEAVPSVAGRFNADFTLGYGGPWPPYSFVNLRLGGARQASHN